MFTSQWPHLSSWDHSWFRKQYFSSSVISEVTYEVYYISANFTTKEHLSNPSVCMQVSPFLYLSAKSKENTSITWNVSVWHRRATAKMSWYGHLALHYCNCTNVLKWSQSKNMLSNPVVNIFSERKCRRWAWGSVTINKTRVQAMR